MRVKIGDIIEIPVDDRFAYAQFSHDNQRYGQLIRVFDCVVPRRPFPVCDVTSRPLRFSTFFPLKVAVRRGIFQVVGNCDIPRELRRFPLFRVQGVRSRVAGKGDDWWLWDGEKETHIGALSPAERRLPIRETLNDTMLIKLVREGWRPEDDPG